ncbi:MAG: helix-turn-helix domain-containing protein [Ignavibacteriales bacterium]
MIRRSEAEYLTVMDIAELLQCTPQHIYSEIGLGRLKAIKIGRRKGIRIHRNELEAWVKGRGLR